MTIPNLSGYIPKRRNSTVRNNLEQSILLNRNLLCALKYLLDKETSLRQIQPTRKPTPNKQGERKKEKKNGSTEEINEELRGRMEEIRVSHEKKLKEKEDYAIKVMYEELDRQSKIRPVFEEEKLMKLQYIRDKFNQHRSRLQEQTNLRIRELSSQGSINMIQQNQNKRRRNLSKNATEILEHWFKSHLPKPYPTDEEKDQLARECSLSLVQINHWFGNKRIRYKNKYLNETALKFKSNPPLTERSTNTTNFNG